MTVWFTSDWHLFHDNILVSCERPFKNAQKMHAAIIENYCDRVREGDVVYFLGDLTMLGPSGIKGVRSLMMDLPGTKHYIMGNHDRLKVWSYTKMGFASVHTSLSIRHGNCQYLLVHDPKEACSWSYAPRVICGHVHNNWVYRSEPKPTVNVGVDLWDFSPVRFSEVVAAFDRGVSSNPKDDNA